MTAVRIALVLILTAFTACSYSSEVVERRQLSPELVGSEPRREDPNGTRRAAQVVEWTREGGEDLVRVEERILADFVTTRTERSIVEVVNSASVNDMGGWWILPMTADFTRAMWVKDLPPGQTRGLGTLIAWVIITPITVGLDAVFGIPHILRMMAYEANETETGMPRDASIWERDVVVDRSDLIPRLEDPQVLVDNRAWLRPTVDETGRLRFDASRIAPLDDAPLPALTLVGRRDGEQLTVELPWPTTWRKQAREDRGLDMRDDVAALGGRAQATARAPARITPGVPATLSVVVTAQGSGDICRLVGEVISDNPWFDGRTLNIGRLSPGQSARADVELYVPGDLPPSGERLTLSFRSSRGQAPADVQVIVRTGLAAPDR